MDTRNKRASAVGFALATLLVLPAPDGTVVQADRQHVSYAYAGIDAGAVTEFPSVTSTSLTAAASAYTLTGAASAYTLTPADAAYTLEAV